jgi:hypothetical protein
MAIMTGHRATTRETDALRDGGDHERGRSRLNLPAEMAQQSSRGYEAAPQSFVRLTGSHLAKPRAVVTG